MEQYQGAEAFLEVLNANGVENIFFNPGGDLAPIQAAVLKYKATGKRAPKLILWPPRIGGIDGSSRSLHGLWAAADGHGA